MTFTRSILVSDWATFTQPVIYPESAAFWNEKTTEERYLNMPRKLFCKCGHVSDGEIAQSIRIPRKEKGWGYVNNNLWDTDGRIITKFEQPELPENFSTETSDYLFRANFVCPECKEPPDLILEWGMHRSHIEYDFVKVFDNRTREENNNTICLSIGITEYYFNSKVEKIGCKSKTVRLTFNINTGMTYAIKATGRRAVINASYGVYPNWMSGAINYVCLNHREEVTEFMRLLIEARLEWTTLEKVESLNRNLYNRLVYVTTLCAIPQLQCLPFTNYQFRHTKDRKKIRQAGFNQRALMQLLAGSASKQVRKYITDENKLFNYLSYGRIFKDQNNLMKVLIADADANPHRVIGYGSIGPSILGLAKDFRDNYGYDIVGLRRDNQIYQFMMNLHRDEAHYANAFIKIKQEVFMGYQRIEQETPEPRPEEGVLYVRPTGPPIYERRFSVQHAWYSCSDIVRILEDILIRDPNYKWEYNGDLQEFHDKLSRDLERYRNPYREIEYSDEEKEIYNRTVKGYTFRLAKSNHELTRVGSDQGICVGGYGNRACDKDCVIVLVENEKGEHRITIELNHARSSYMAAIRDDNCVLINQAKLKRNARPDRTEAEIVAEWCYETNTVWEHCFDLENAKGCEWPEVPTGEPPTWIQVEPQQRQQAQYLIGRREAQRLMGIEPDPVPEFVQQFENIFMGQAQNILVQQGEVQPALVANPAPAGIEIDFPF